MRSTTPRSGEGCSSSASERGIAVIAHSPFGGPRRARALARRPELVGDRTCSRCNAGGGGACLGARRLPTGHCHPGSTAAGDCSIGGTRSLNRVDTTRAIRPRRRVRLAASRTCRRLGTRDGHGGGRGGHGRSRRGKSRHAEEYVARGYVRLNRDERGGSLREISDALDAALASGERRIVLDNTYLTRAARSHIIEEAARHRAVVRCIWIDTPLAQAQVNMVERLLDRLRLAARSRSDQRTWLAASQDCSVRPGRCAHSVSSSRRRRTRASSRCSSKPFERSLRAPANADDAAAVFVAAGALSAPGLGSMRVNRSPRTSMHLLFDWQTGCERRRARFGRRSASGGCHAVRSSRRSARIRVGRPCAGAGHRFPGSSVEFARTQAST